MRTPGSYELLHRDAGTGARRGRLWTAHGPVDTPAFMPVGTQATVKGMLPRDLTEIGVQMLLANTYHLNLRPGPEIVETCGGLHRFMGWDGPILTDSGGYQVFSLADLRTVRADGVEFRSHLDGARVFLGPREAMEIQRRLGSDVAMVLDECPPWPCDRQTACQAVSKTLTWATLCVAQPRAAGQLVFGIVQGGAYPEERERCARGLLELGFDGYAIGGVSVGEPEEELLGAVRACAPWLPDDRPRYLMGVGRMRQIVEAVAQGVDMFDCVLPTRLARNGTAFTRLGRYPVKAAAYKADLRPVEEGCGCYTCARFTRAYVRHLLHAGEMLGGQLLTLHNLFRYAEWMRELREAIEAGRFEAFRSQFLARCDPWESTNGGRGADEPALAGEESE